MFLQALAMAYRFGHNQSARVPQTLGQMWNQEANVGLKDAPALVVKSTFLHFELHHADQRPRSSSAGCAEARHMPTKAHSNLFNKPERFFWPVEDVRTHVEDFSIKHVDELSTSVEDFSRRVDDFSTTPENSSTPPEDFSMPEEHCWANLSDEDNETASTLPSFTLSCSSSDCDGADWTPGNSSDPTVGFGSMQMDNPMQMQMCLAVPVFVSIAQPEYQEPFDLLAALNARKAAFGTTVAKLSEASLKAEMFVAKKTSKRVARRLRKANCQNTNFQNVLSQEVQSQVQPSELPASPVPRGSKKNKSKRKGMSDVESQGTAEEEEDESQKATSEGNSTGKENAGLAMPTTTLMLRKLPLKFTRSLLLELLDSEGFEGSYDFVYCPIHFKTHLGFGYAFVNFVSHDLAESARNHLQGFRSWEMPHGEICETFWSHPHQGYAANVERYRNSPLMHESVPDGHKPILFANGVRQAFPDPDKNIQPPKVVRRTIPIQAAAQSRDSS